MVERRVEEEAGMTFRVMDKIQVGARSAPTLFSASDGEADGSATLEGFLEPLVEAVVGGVRLGDYARKKVLADNDFPLLES